MTSQRLHASCAARGTSAVLLLGPSGAGKSDLLLRLIDRGFVLVADDQVDLASGQVSPPPALAGLIEARGQGLLRLPHVAPAALRLVVHLRRCERLPEPSVPHRFGVREIEIDPWTASAALRVDLALACITGGSVQCLNGAAVVCIEGALA